MAAQMLSAPDGTECSAFTDFFPGPRNEAYYQLWRRHLATDIPHDAYPGVLNLSSRLWRLYGNKEWKAAESPSFWVDATGIVTGGNIGHSLPEPGFLKAVVELLGREENEIPFNISRSTDAYTSEGVVNLYPTGSVVAKYRDAGLDIERKQFTGVELVPMMNPGSMIDPALQGWPNNAFVPASPNVDLPGWFFGFDPDVVSSIHIRNFTGTKVQIGFKYKSPGKNFVLYDGGSGKPAEDNKLTSKTVNDRKLAGYFGGNETNKKLGDRDEHVPYFIGKFLGDALQVIFLMPCLPNLSGTWVSNPFFPIGNTGQFREFTSPSAGRSPATPLFGNALITTGDALNYTRAILLRISGMYIGPPNAQKIWPCRFMPGRDMVVDNLAYCTKTYAAFDAIRTLLGKRFDAAKKAVNDSITDTVKPGTENYFNNEYSKISGLVQLSTDVHRSVAHEFMVSVRSCIDAAETEVGLYLTGLINSLEPRATTQAAAADARKMLSEVFKQLSTEVNSLAPRGPFVIGNPRGEIGSVIQTYPIAETERNSYKVKFAEAIAEIKKVKVGDSTKWMDIWRSKPRLITPGPPAAGGGRRKTGRNRKGSRKAPRKQRGGAAEARGSTVETLYINAFSGLINAGIAFYSLNPEKAIMADFIEEATADVEKIKTLAKPEIGPGPDAAMIMHCVINNGGTTLVDFIEFLSEPTGSLANVNKVSDPLLPPAWVAYDGKEVPPATDMLSRMTTEPDKYMNLLVFAVHCIDEANQGELRDETLFAEMRSELTAIRNMINAPPEVVETTAWPELGEVVPIAAPPPPVPMEPKLNVGYESDASVETLPSRNKPKPSPKQGVFLSRDEEREGVEKRAVSLRGTLKKQLTDARRKPLSPVAEGVSPPALPVPMVYGGHRKTHRRRRLPKLL